ncbi:unnamed protein product [Owenia fusiformis]|uniref:Uncharacterized protein n=1 Tax=Owenia fusiformis TaxID=6347 RepID=A0A8J1UXQ6_OWEFU|nr:unnamed protein product [Owenia fusiformis]
MTSQSATYDALLTDTIGIGRYQYLCSAGLIIANIIEFWQISLTNFTAAFMDHWCHIPEIYSVLNTSVHTEDVIKSVTIPLENRGGIESYSKCRIYAVNFSAFSEEQLLSGIHKINATTRACRDGWHFDTSHYVSTLMSQYDLVCEDEYLTTFSASALVVGSLIGGYISGQVADRFGRLTTARVMYFILFASATGAIYAPTYAIYLVLRIFVGIGLIAGYTPHFVSCVEMLTSRGRSVLIIVMTAQFIVTLGPLPLTAYFVRNHITLQFIAAGILLIPIVIVLFTPESARWHLSVGQVDAATGIIKTMTTTNGRATPDNYEEIIKAIAENERSLDGGHKGTIIDLCRTPRLRRHTFIIFAIWFADIFGNYAMRFNIGTLVPGNIYLNMYLVFGLGSALQLPIHYLAHYKIGRVKTFTIALVLSGVLSLSMIGLVTIQGLPILAAIASLIGTAFIETIHRIIYIYSGEIFPTPARGAGVGCGSSIGRIGSLVAPQIPLLGNIWYGLPYVAMGVIPIIVGIMCFWLPETMNKRMPDTFVEGELFGLLRIAKQVSFVRNETTNDNSNGNQDEECDGKRGHTDCATASVFSIDPYYTDINRGGKCDATASVVFK